MNGLQRLAQAERDCVDLHKALAEALRRLAAAQDVVRNVMPQPGALDLWEMLKADDLLAVLDRTSGTSIDDAAASVGPRMWDGVPSNPYPRWTDRYEEYQVQHGEP